MKTWISGSNGNRASIERWGDEAGARRALASLENCSGCSDCSDCYGCYDCSGCSRCYDCYGCSGCSGCSRCYDCSGCSRCSGCYDCYGCSGCSRCSGCSDLKDAAPVEAQASQALTVPTVEDLHAKIYEAATATPEAFDMSDVHGCSTTHCRAGWAVHLAGDAGYALEARFGWELAAMKIYDASCPGYKISPVRFYDSDEAALADMKKLAGVK